MTTEPKGEAKGEPKGDEVPAATPEVTPGAFAEAGERLHKFLAATGAGSRRECETFIEQGRVAVNGKVVTKLGTKVDPAKDKVTLDGEPAAMEDHVYYLLNKPQGYICTNSDEMGRPRAVDLIRDAKHRIYTVGRLDAESTGLILLTNDGAIANVMCHPRYRIEKAYLVVVRGEVDREQVSRIESGVWLAEGKSSPARVRLLGRNPRRDETMLEITLFEGRNREVRRVFGRVGVFVRRLTRTRIGPLEIQALPPGQYVRLPAGALEFVREAEKMYLANKDAWDAEVAKPPKPRPTFRRKTGPGAKGRFGGPGRGPARGNGPMGGAARRPDRGFGQRPDRGFGDRPDRGFPPRFPRPPDSSDRPFRPYPSGPGADRGPGPGPDRGPRPDAPPKPRRYYD